MIMTVGGLSEGASPLSLAHCLSSMGRINSWVQCTSVSNVLGKEKIFPFNTYILGSLRNALYWTLCRTSQYGILFSFVGQLFSFVSAYFTLFLNIWNKTAVWRRHPGSVWLQPMLSLHRKKEMRKVQFIWRTYTKLTLKTHSNMQ